MQSKFVALIEFEREARVKSYIRDGKRIKGHRRRFTKEQKRKNEYIASGTVGAASGMYINIRHEENRRKLRNFQQQAGMSYEDIVNDVDKLKRYRQDARMHMQMGKMERSYFKIMDKDLTTLIDDHPKLKQLEKTFEPKKVIAEELKNKYESIDRRKDWSPEQKAKAKLTLERKHIQPGKIVKYDPKMAEDAVDVGEYKRFKNAYYNKLESYFPKKFNVKKYAKTVALGGLVTGGISLGGTYLRHRVEDFIKRKKNVS